MHRILVVEDDPAILKGLAQNLRDERYDVLTAADAETGLSLLQESHPDLVLLDLMLPRMSGYELCRRVRANGRSTPIVMLSARSEEADRILGLDVGADDYVAKPFSIAELLARIRAILRQRREWTADYASMEADLRAAAEVQRGLLPLHHPDVPGLDYTARCISARAIGGDYFDFLDIADGLLGIVVADVSGKGTPAALVAATLHGAIRSQPAAVRRSAADLTREAGRLLHDATAGARYATMFYAIVDSRAGMLHYANAGHPAGLLIRAGEDPMTLGASGFPIAMFEDARCTEESCALVGGDCLVMMSDGVTEAANSSEDAFGESGVAAIVRQFQSCSAARICTELENAVREHTGGTFADDFTVAVVRIDDRAERS
jgi:sigma-B regulation protein RsbU (phosphoserine phosphatase)